MDSLFDIASLDTRTRAEVGVPMTLVHPKTRGPVTHPNGTPVTITLLGRASDTYRDKQRELNERGAEVAARNIRRSRDELENDDIELLVACTVDWNISRMDGEDFPFNAANARRLWSDPRYRWLRDQSIGHILTDGNFLPA